jgi:hypothetical protein
MTDSVALAALTISLIALFVTLGQVLQQYFSTADGYRQCLPSVMGCWGKMTHMRWRWREFRFETIYYIPRISIETSHTAMPSSAMLREKWDNLDLSRTYILTSGEVSKNSQVRAKCTFSSRLATSLNRSSIGSLSC